MMSKFVNSKIISIPIFITSIYSKVVKHWVLIQLAWEVPAREDSVSSFLYPAVCLLERLFTSDTILCPYIIHSRASKGYLPPTLFSVRIPFIAELQKVIYLRHYSLSVCHSQQSFKRLFTSDTILCPYIIHSRASKDRLQAIRIQIERSLCYL